MPAHLRGRGDVRPRDARVVEVGLEERGESILLVLADRPEVDGTVELVAAVGELHEACGPS